MIPNQLIGDFLSFKKEELDHYQGKYLFKFASAIIEEKWDELTKGNSLTIAN